MLSSVNQHTKLPSARELPYSDETPVDNEDQNLLPNLLLQLLIDLWADRMDWFFGVDMGIYHTTGEDYRAPVVPDGFLSLGVERKKGGESRLSYVIWEEEEIPPILALEMVSQTPGNEYSKKMEVYACLGVLYYAIYNPKFWQRDRHEPFEVYKLEGDRYQLISVKDPVWMPEVGLGLGRYQAVLGNVPTEILTWYDAQGDRHLTLAEREYERAEREYARAERERLAKEQERQAKERLEAFLRSQGIDPDRLPE